MARVAELQNKRTVAQEALDRLNRKLLRGGSSLQQKKTANKVRWQLAKIKDLDNQLSRIK